jgi:SRSO17 transposase
VSTPVESVFVEIHIGLGAEMNHRQTDDSESRFAGYVEGLASVIGHKDREGPLRDYCTGLLMPCERKSVEPMAAITAPHRTAAQHQSLLHFIGEGKWSDEKVLAKVREMVVPQMQRHGAIEAWIIDDTGFPKQGKHSVGVARQYCGQLGKQDNCQVAVSLSLANRHASLPVAYQLYLPQDWAQDRERRRKVGIPELVEFKTKPEIALEQLRWAHEAGLPRGVALLDAGYGNNTALRDGITALEMPYAVGISATTTVWAPRRCRRSSVGRVAAGRRSACAAIAGIGRSPSKRWRYANPSQRGRPSLGAKEPPRRSLRALLACAFARRIATRNSPNRARRNGC